MLSIPPWPPSRPTVGNCFGTRPGPNNWGYCQAWCVTAEARCLPDVQELKRMDHPQALLLPDVRQMVLEGQAANPDQ